VAYDGQFIWVTSSAANTVSKLRASDGSLVGTYAAGLGPLGVAFDGANIWVANNGTSSLSKF
jgi:DNA-binding beta-propeller fold protein YncE